MRGHAGPRARAGARRSCCRCRCRRAAGQRGFNQALLLARRLAPGKTDARCCCGCATRPRRRRWTAARQANVRDAFGVEPLRAAGARPPVLLVDDVMTSGASLFARRRCCAAGRARRGVVLGRSCTAAALGGATIAADVPHRPGQPEIPPNTGNVIRLAANTGCTLHLVEPLGFSMDDKHMRRAGLDYHEYAEVRRHADWAAFLAPKHPIPRSDVRPHHARHAPGARRGLRAGRLAGVRLGNGAAWRPSCASASPAQRLRLPMRAGQRSLNLSNAVAVTVFEAWRQNGFAQH
jgi:tRNA (cytidine/uridine-2'-O-)-methyltransferase